MDTNQSIEILKSLADGVDPTTGEIFAMDSPYNNPVIIRAMFGCLALLKTSVKKIKRTPEEKKDDNVAKGLPRNAGMAWTQVIRTELADQFNAAIRPNELAVKFERSLGSIVAELKNQGLINENEARSYRS